MEKNFKKDKKYLRKKKKFLSKFKIHTCNYFFFPFPTMFYLTDGKAKAFLISKASIKIRNQDSQKLIS